MKSHAIIRVVCDDGPCRGSQYLESDTGHVLFSGSAEAADTVYAIDDEPGGTHTSLPHAHVVDVTEQEQAC